MGEQLYYKCFECGIEVKGNPNLLGGKICMVCGGNVLPLEENERERFYRNIEERLRHLLESSFIRSFDASSNGKYKRDIREADKTPAPKPPLGIMPAKLFYGERLEELKQAICRRADANMAMPLEWVEEYNELVRRYGQC